MQEGYFGGPPSERLDKDQIDFLIEFPKSVGNFPDIARELGLSFPTVKARFHAILKTMGIAPEGAERTEVAYILNMLEKGEITGDEAERSLEGA